jgi:hypothetical protein
MSMGTVLTCGLIFPAIIPWVGTPLQFSTKVAFTLGFGSCAIGFALFVAWFASVRAELNESVISRSTLFGRKSLQLDQIDSALFSSVKGVIFLTVRAGRHWITFSTYTFSRPQLDEIQSFIAKMAAESSRAVQTTRPPWTTKQAVEFGVAYLLLIVVVFTAIAIGGIHNLQSRSPRCKPVACGSSIRGLGPRFSVAFKAPGVANPESAQGSKAAART